MRDVYDGLHGGPDAETDHVSDNNNDLSHKKYFIAFN